MHRGVGQRLRRPYLATARVKRPDAPALRDGANGQAFLKAKTKQLDALDGLGTALGRPASLQLSGLGSAVGAKRSTAGADQAVPT